MATSWRDVARPIVARAKRDGLEQGLQGKDLRKYVQSFYPFGERAMHPYKIWLDEMKRQLVDNRPLADDLSNYWRDLVREESGR